MNFQPDLAAKVMAGEKTVTRRLVSANPRSPWYEGGCRLVAGRTYAVCPGRGLAAIGRVRIVSVALRHLGHLTDREALREGFQSDGGLPPGMVFERAWAQINGAYDKWARVWRVEFEVVTDG